MPTDPTPNGLDRRAALAALGLAGAGLAAASAFAQQPETDATSPQGFFGWDPTKGEYVLPALPYAYDALEPHIDAETMRIHHDKHHAGYVAGLNKAVAELAKIRAGTGDASLIKHWSRELAFHGGGHFNHCWFWLTMLPPKLGGGEPPTGALAEGINRDFGSFDAFKKQFVAAANAVEGSGWGWLVYDRMSRHLLVQQMEKQQNMLLTGCIPLVCCDVWEHAYYLKYQNKRSDYINAFFNVINWKRVGPIYQSQHES